MTFEGDLYKEVEWNGETEHDGIYLRFPGEIYDHYNAVLAIRPQDVEAYTKLCKETENEIMELQNTLNQMKARFHRYLIPLK